MQQRKSTWSRKQVLSGNSYETEKEEIRMKSSQKKGDSAHILS